MDQLTQTFEERLQEIETYLDLLEVLERQVQEGPPKIGQTAITAQQQKILYSSVYLQLYNLIEATVTWCVEAVCSAVAEKGRWRPADLVEQLRREWVRSMARTHLELNKDHKLEAAVQLCDHLIQALPVMAWSVEGGRRGNWDDEEIRDITARLGCDLKISTDVYKGIKRPVREEKGSLVLVRHLRNKLAHGTLSFTECGDGVTVPDLRDLKERTASYLREVVSAFRAYIDTYGFLVPASRP
jgi:MAE_28990/MAE_18760-like HEPN